MNKPATEIIVCDECAAPNRLSATECWLCFATLNPRHTMSSDVIDSGQHPFADRQRLSDMFWLQLDIAVLILVCLVGLGMLLANRGAFVLYLLALTPAFIAAGVRYVVRDLRGKEVGPLHALNAFVLFAVPVVAIAIALFIALLVLLAICLGPSLFR